MNTFARILPFLWPSRKQLLLSFFFAFLVAVLWGGNLSIAFPVVKVLVEGENAQSYVKKQIDECDATIKKSEQELAEYNQQLKGADQNEELSLLRKIARADGRMTKASSRLAILRWVNVHVVPRVPTDRFNTFTLILRSP